jgi:glutaredoxin 3
MSETPLTTLVYTTNFCGYCVRAKRLLEARGFPYTEISVAGDNAARMELMQRTGWRTLPQIFVGDTFVGGADELSALDRAGKLEGMVMGGAD